LKKIQEPSQHGVQDIQLEIIKGNIVETLFSYQVLGVW